MSFWLSLSVLSLLYSESGCRVFWRRGRVNDPVLGPGRLKSGSLVVTGLENAACLRESLSWVRVWEPVSLSLVFGSLVGRWSDSLSLQKVRSLWGRSPLTQVGSGHCQSLCQCRSGLWSHCVPGLSQGLIESRLRPSHMSPVLLKTVVPVSPCPLEHCLFLWKSPLVVFIYVFLAD